jgi:tetratricopeptide (TPR) repeat protein
MPDSAYFWKTMNDYGLSCLKQGQVSEAEHCFRQALQHAKKAGFRGDDERMMSTTESLALCLLHLSRFDESEKLYKQLYQMELNRSGQDSPEISRIKSSLGQVCLEQNKLEDARFYLSVALPVLVQSYGKENELVKKTLSSLEFALSRAQLVYKDLADKDKLQRFSDETKAVIIAAFGEHHYAVKNVQSQAAAVEEIRTGHEEKASGKWEELFRDAVMAESEGRLDDADALLGHATSLAEQVGEVDERYADSLFRRAQIKLKKAELPGAEEYTKKALCAYFKIDPGSLQVARCLDILAFMYLNKQNMKMAEQCAWSALEIFLCRLPYDHIEVGQCMRCLAFVNSKFDRALEAHWLYMSALSIFERTYGSDDPEVKDLIAEVEDFVEANREYLEVSDTEPSAELKNDGFICKSKQPGFMAFRAITLAVQEGYFLDAEFHFKQAIDLWKKQHGEDHHHVTRTYRQLADLYKANESYEKAGDYYTKTWDLMESQKPIVFQRIVCLKQFADLLRMMNRPEVAREAEQKAKHLDLSTI